SVLDTTTGRVVRTVTVGHYPMGVAVDERIGRAFVTNQNDNSVSILDSASGTVLRKVAVGPAPVTLAVAAHAGRVFVVNHGNNTVSVLDARGGGRRRTVTVGTASLGPPQSSGGENPVDVAVDERGDRVFVINGNPADGNGNPTSGRVSVLDARTGALLRTVPV